MSPPSALQSLVVALAVAVWIALPILPTDSFAALPEIDEPLLVAQGDDSDSDSEEDSDGDSEEDSDEPELREGKPRGDADEDSDSDLEEDSEDEPDLRDGKTRP